MKRITGAALVTLMGTGLLVGGATGAVATEICVPSDAVAEVPPVFKTEVVTPAIPAKDAVYKTVVVKPAVAEVVVTEYEYTHKNPNHPQSPRWYTDEAWNAESVAQSRGWEKTGKTRSIVVTPGQAEVTEQQLVSEAVAEVPAVTEERLVTPGVPAKDAVTCPPPTENQTFDPITIDWMLAPGSTIDNPFRGGDQPRYSGTPDCGVVLQRDTYYPENQAELDLVNSLGDSLSLREDFGVGGEWLEKTWVFVTLDDCVAPEIPEEPETPVTPPMTPPVTPVNPDLPPEEVTPVPTPRTSTTVPVVFTQICEDFTDQTAAQASFNAGNRGLDGNRNGVACDYLLVSQSHDTLAETGSNLTGLWAALGVVMVGSGMVWGTRKVRASIK